MLPILKRENRKPQRVRFSTASLTSSLFAIVCTLTVSVALPAHAQSATGDDLVRKEYRIPARDGVNLYVVVVSPKAQTESLPIMLVRTPYGVSQNMRPGPLPVAYAELAKDGYIFAFGDIRGTGKSEGRFTMNGAMHDPVKNPKGTDEATDTYDTIDWLIKNIAGNNGKVGMMGVSFPGWLAGVGALSNHPALKAVSPQAPMTDTWMGDDFFHQGAFRQSFGVEYATSMEWSRQVPSPVKINRYDRYDWYMQFLTLKELGEKNGIDTLPSWRGFKTHPAWDEYWQAKAMQVVWTKPNVAVLNVGGYWDQEDIFGPQGAYRALEKADTLHQWNSIVLGPWFHGGWAGRMTDSFGPMKFGSDVGLYYRANIERPWFRNYLHGDGTQKFKEAYMYETQGNVWRTFDSWPPREAVPTKLYLHANGSVSFTAPRSAGKTSYTSDPMHPVPYLARPVDGTRWRGWLVEDQRFVHNRPDVLSWESKPLEQDIVIAGDVTAHLFASTTGSDADWVVKLIDVYPDSVAEDRKLGGYQLMVAGDIMRGRYYKSFSKPRALVPNAVTKFNVDMHQQVYRFKKGHRIMVQVQSTWFPLYDRNPQTYVANIFEAKPADFKARVHTIHSSPAAPSNIEVGVLPPG